RAVWRRGGVPALGRAPPGPAWPPLLPSASGSCSLLGLAPALPPLPPGGSLAPLLSPPPPALLSSSPLPLPLSLYSASLLLLLSPLARLLPQRWPLGVPHPEPLSPWRALAVVPRGPPFEPASERRARLAAPLSGRRRRTRGLALPA